MRLQRQVQVPLRWAGAFLLLLFLSAGASPAVAGENILLVGNSFTAGVKARLKAVVRSAGHEASIKVRAVDGWSLGDHAASDKTMRKLRALPWDAVILQEQSAGIYLSRYPAARYLDQEIREAGGRSMFFMTWRDEGDALANYDTLRGVLGGTIGYVPIAFELDVPIAPVGWAFRESIVANPDVELWGPDGHHSSERGRYLAALVLFATIYGESPVGLWASPFLTEEEALHDQLLVERVVLGAPNAWNIQ